MPRIRSVKPETPHDKKLALVSRDARLTFIYCWTIADDDGLFRAEPRQLMGDLYPHDIDVTAHKLEKWLHELVGIGVLRWRRTLDGARVGEIVNFAKHQAIQNRSKSFLLHQLTPFSQNPSEGVEINNDGVGKNYARSLEPRVLSQESYTSVFEQAWKAYPRRHHPDSKQAAFRQWQRRVTEGVSEDAMLAGAIRYGRVCKDDGSWGTKYVKMAATFFGPDRHFEVSEPEVSAPKPRRTKWVEGQRAPGMRSELIEVPIDDPRPEAA